MFRTFFKNFIMIYELIVVSAITAALFSGGSVGVIWPAIAWGSPIVALCIAFSITSSQYSNYVKEGIAKKT